MFWCANIFIFIFLISFSNKKVRRIREKEMMMHALSSLISVLATLSCFILMTETCQKGGWVRRLKFVYLWTLFLIPLAQLCSISYVCQLLRFLSLFSAFVILCQAPYHRLSLFKKGCLSCLYCGVIMQTATLIGEQLLYLMF